MIRINSNGFAFLELLIIFGIFFLFQFLSNSYTSRHTNEAVWVGKMDWRLRALAVTFFAAVGLIMFVFQKYNHASPMSLVNLKMVTLILVMMFVSNDVVIIAFDVIVLGYLVFRGVNPHSLFYIAIYFVMFLIILLIGNSSKIKHWFVRLLFFNITGLLFWVGYYSYNVLIAKIYTVSFQTILAYMGQMVLLISIPYTVSYSMQQNQEMIFKRTQEAYLDGLTHVYNYHAFNLNIEHTFQRSQEKKLPMSMMIMDLDHFKSVNDTYGHLAGNYVLVHFCAIVVGVIKSNADIAVYRIGGEEFAVVFTGTSLPSALAVSNRIMAAVRAAEFVYKDAKIPLTFSAGLTELQAQDETSKQFFDRADILTYTAKRHGGDQIVTESHDLASTAAENMAAKITAADTLAAAREHSETETER
ncbi:GGDEF domain-containing protein [Lapidilactobacillus luobeiensis]|uniref:GGDEF domain-containing protein n=1 Tax=Lapidilactobacillus luobeiensis TaxID=2950371 RepID=UPI0021C2A3F3|nr:GGDEF domain-containing protein [Lapidilactobacillus luobeiensis]